MANVLNRTTGTVFPYRKDYRTSVNEPDFPQVDWIWNPDLSAVDGFESIYWDISGDTVLLADQATRDSRDAEIAAQQVLDEKASAKAEFLTRRELIALIELIIDELNLLRQQFNTTTSESGQLTDTTFTDRTLSQVRSALNAMVDSQ